MGGQIRTYPIRFGQFALAQILEGTLCVTDLRIYDNLLHITDKISNQIVCLKSDNYV